MGHHRFIKVNLSMEVADPALPGAPATPDAVIKAGLIGAIGNFKPQIQAKLPGSQIKNVQEIP